MEALSKPFKTFSLMFALLAAVAVTRGVQAADSADPALARLELLNEKIELLNQRLDRQEQYYAALLERERQVNHQALRNEIDSELRDALSKVDEATSALNGKYTEMAGLLTGVVAVALAVFATVISWAKRRIQTEISDEIDRKKDLVRSMVDLFELEQTMISNYRLEVVANESSHGEQLVGVLKRLGFGDVGQVTIEAAQASKADMLVFDEDLPDPEVDQFLTQMAEDRTVVCFYTKGNRNITPANRNKTNFANSYLTLYSRVIETLKATRALRSIG